MYQQIERNKIKTIVAILLFFALWMSVGGVIGAILGFQNGGSLDQFGNPVYVNSTAWGSVVVGATIALIAAVLVALYSFSAGTQMVLRASGAFPADPIQYQQFHNIVETLAIGDGLPKPTVWVINDPSPNAFATGTSPNRAAICATTGLLQMMNREELEGVISHEMSHIKNYDVRLILAVSTLLGLAGLIASIIWRSAFYMRPRGRDGGQFILVIFAAALLFTIIAFVIGPLVQLMLSRTRESLADVSGVELTRNPAGLISALQKLQQNDKPFAKFNHATAAMCIDDPLQHHEAWYHHLFDTHPPLAQRIAVLQRIASGPAV